jgi:hypothetical protein
MLMLSAYFASQLAATPHLHPGESLESASWRPHVHLLESAACDDHAAAHAATVSRHGHDGAACTDENRACVNGHVVSWLDHEADVVYLALSGETAVRCANRAPAAAAHQCASALPPGTNAGIASDGVWARRLPESTAPHCAHSQRLRPLRI